MSEPADDRTDEIEQALRTVQEQERAEQRSDLERQRRFDDGLADALSDTRSDSDAR